MRGWNGHYIQLIQLRGPSPYRYWCDSDMVVANCKRVYKFVYILYVTVVQSFVMALSILCRISFIIRNYNKDSRAKAEVSIRQLQIEAICLLAVVFVHCIEINPIGKRHILWILLSKWQLYNWCWPNISTCVFAGIIPWLPNVQITNQGLMIIFLL